MQKELEEAQKSCSESKKIMDEKNREIEELKSKILSEDEMNRKNEDYKAELKRILNLERELKTLETRIQNDEDQLEADEDSIKQTRSEIDSERKMLQLNTDASNKMITLYKQQYEKATERYQTLLQQIENTKTSNDTDQLPG